MKTEEMRINDEIRARRVVVIGETGARLGEYLIADAIALAEEQNLDLVEVGSENDKPICKIMNYGKFVYERKKRQNHSASSEVKLKELKLSVRTEEHDIQTRVNQAHNFLSRGDKVKFTLTFTGRETAHQRLGFEKLNDIITRLESVGVVDSEPKQNMNTISMILAKK